MSIGISNLCKRMQESPTLAISEKAQQLSREGYQVISFGVGEPDFQTPEFIRDAAKTAVDEGYTKYTSVAGTIELRNAIVDKLRKDHGLVYQPNQIIVSNGAKHSIYNCLRAILDPGDEVILPAPCWASYPEMIELCGGIPVIVQGDVDNNFLPHFEDIKNAVSHRTKAILINSPSNPCGNIWNEQLLRAVAALALDKQFYIISDEIYEKLIYDGKQHFSIARASEEAKALCIIINGASKAYSMTGFRIGYAAGPKDVIAAMTTFQSQTTTSAVSMAQYAATIAFLSDDSCCATMKDGFEHRRNTLVRMLNEIPMLSCNRPEGAFYIMVDVRRCIGKAYQNSLIKNDMDFAALLLEDAKVAVVPGEPFFAPGFCRLSYALEEALAVEGVQRIADFVSKLK